MGLKAHLDLGFAPSHSPRALGLGGGGTSLPGASPLPHLAYAALRGGGPTWWTPGTLPVVRVRYRYHPKLFR